MTSAIYSLVRIWKISHSYPGYSFVWKIPVVRFSVKHSYLCNKFHYFWRAMGFKDITVSGKVIFFPLLGLFTMVRCDFFRLVYQGHRFRVICKTCGPLKQWDVHTAHDCESCLYGKVRCLITWLFQRRDKLWAEEKCRLV